MKLLSTLSLLLALGWLTAQAQPAVPITDPGAGYRLPWTAELKWSQVVNIADVAGESLETRVEQGQKMLAAKGGGVLYFPAGTYHFKASLRLKNGIVLRGANPAGPQDARADNYALPTQFEFPRYRPSFQGEGTPVSTAFQGIQLEHPASASNCGVVNIAINRGHIEFAEGAGHACGKNRVVFGCRLRNAATADPAVPSAKYGQHSWQRWTARHHAAIHVDSAENALIANNRLPKSGEDNFQQKGYILHDSKGKPLVVEPGVLFDYDNRPGIYANDFGIGPGGGNGTAGTPASYPWGFRKGTVIRNNYIYCSGRCAIAFTGDGTLCAGNVIRFPKDVGRWTTTGLVNVTGSGTNDNRAVQMRGYRWAVEDNDYEVHSNIALPSKYRINDGEGLMHEAHVNSSVVGSRLIGNRGNAYISIYRVHGVDGLHIKGNEIRTTGKIPTIFVLSGFHKKDFPARNVVIENNSTAGSGILLAGNPAENNIIRHNRHQGPGGTIRNWCNARLEDNEGYEVVTKEKQ